MLVGIALAAVVALVIGLPALRIRGPFLAVTTLAFAVTAGSYFLEDRYFPWFIQDSITRPTLWDRIPLDENWKMYYFALGRAAARARRRVQPATIAHRTRADRRPRQPARRREREHRLDASSSSSRSCISGAHGRVRRRRVRRAPGGIFTGSFDPR